MAVVLDKYLSSVECSAHNYVKHDKIKFHSLDRPDPDYLVSCSYHYYIDGTSLIVLAHIICPFQLKVCVTLVIAASLEVEHGIENLWATLLDGFKDPLDYGKYIPVHYFRAFICGFPHLWSPEKLWYSNNMPWESFIVE